MKKILITGANSYIGTSFEKYMNDNYPNEYSIDTVDMIGNGWKEKDFSSYDSVFHVAGIAHQKETRKNAALYYQVNRDLAIETACKAKEEGVKQFVFLSSMSIYGLETGIITKESQPTPKTNYGKSKWQAEQSILNMMDDSFHICILRPPMVYGEGCKGNYQVLVKLATILPILPTYYNQRSMIHIDRLSKCVKEYVDTNANGVYIPQDEKYVCTCDMIINIRTQMGKRFKLVNILNPFIALSVLFTLKGRKAFGNLIYVNNHRSNTYEE